VRRGILESKSARLGLNLCFPRLSHIHSLPAQSPFHKLDLVAKGALALYAEKLNIYI
jgi:hypothetical protein